MTKNTSKSSRVLKRVVIKEELVELTGDLVSALVLNQFLYWGQRVNDFDAFIEEEKERDPDNNALLTHGWIFKSAKQLTEELMFAEKSEDKIARTIAKLVDAGWLERRNNPYSAWDRKYQYRPAIKKIQKDLQEIGYALEGYPLLSSTRPIPHSAEWIPHSAGAIVEITI